MSDLLTRADLDPDPLVQLMRWLDEARSGPLPEPGAVVLATADAQGRPSARVVLCKGIDASGLRFFTNQESRKGEDLAANPWGAATFYWPLPAPERQARLEGPVTRLSGEESDAYFATRPRESRIGAWASPQSRVLADRAELWRRHAEAQARFAGGPVPRPPHWGGYLLSPDTVELWIGRPHRLHDRFLYRRAVGGWRVERLAP